jgi:hypothetical protein
MVLGIAPAGARTNSMRKAATSAAPMQRRNGMVKEPVTSLI